MNKKVLVVDDDPVVRILVNEFLSSQGYAVETVETGSACIESLSHGRPDVIVMDLMMPEMNGIELMQYIRSNPSTAALPIVMMSSDPDTASVATTNNVKADGYILKPFGLREILGAIEGVKTNEDSN